VFLETWTEPEAPQWFNKLVPKLAWTLTSESLLQFLGLNGRFDRLAIVLCLLLGWSGVTAYDSLASVLPSSAR
jgi:predicted membrane channel-forming protein YqfA (hemolysin III family)